MKKHLKIVTLLLAVGLLAGCKPTPSVDPSVDPGTSVPVSEDPTSEETPLTQAEFDLAIDVIAKTVPLAVERNTGSVIRTNIYRNAQDPADPVPELRDGNAITLITGGTLSYEDEENEVYLYPDYEISWSYYGEGDEASTYAKYEFETDKEGFLTAIPGYPVYVPEFDGGGNLITPIPPAKVGRLYATVKIGDWTKRLNIDMYLHPQERIDYYDMDTARDLPAGKPIKVRGYVTGIFADWNSAGIADGDVGFGLYKLKDSGLDGVFSVGDLVEVTGLTSNYNGLAQLQWLKAAKVLDPAEYPEIESPVVNQWTHDDLEQSLLVGLNDPTAPLFSKDNSLVKFDAPFKFLRVEDRNGVDVGFDGFDITGSQHTNVILEGKTSADKAFEVKLSINYHMGAEEQQKIKAFLQANETTPFYYEGPLSAYNEFVLGPYHFEGCFIAS